MSVTSYQINERRYEQISCKIESKNLTERCFVRWKIILDQTSNIKHISLSVSKNQEQHTWTLNFPLMMSKNIFNSHKFRKSFSLIFFFIFIWVCSYISQYLNCYEIVRVLLLLMLECDNKNVISINWLSNRSTHRVCLFSLLVHSQIQSPQLHSIDKVRLRRNAKKPYLTVLSQYFPCPMTSPLTGPIIGLHGLLAT